MILLEYPRRNNRDNKKVRATFATKKKKKKKESNACIIFSASFESWCAITVAAESLAKSLVKSLARGAKSNSNWSLDEQ